MVYPLPGGRILYIQKWFSMVCTSILDHKAEDNLAQDEITEAEKREQERHQGVQVQLQEKFEDMFFQKKQVIIFYKEMTFTFPGQWPWTIVDHSSEEKLHAQDSVAGMVSHVRCIVKNRATIRSEAHPDLFAQGSTLSSEILQKHHMVLDWELASITALEKSSSAAWLKYFSFLLEMLSKNAFLTESNTIKIWSWSTEIVVYKPKFHLFQEMCEFQGGNTGMLWT